MPLLAFPSSDPAAFTRLLITQHVGICNLVVCTRY